MNYVAVLFAGLLAAQVAAGHSDKELPLRFLGGFTDFRETGEHVYGYELELWRRSDGTLIGVPTAATCEASWSTATASVQRKWKASTCVECGMTEVPSGNPNARRLCRKFFVG